MFEPLLKAELQTQIHVAAAILAIIIGPLAIFRRKRDRLHKTLGYGWIAAMIVTVASSMFIYNIRLIGPFSPIHFLSLYTAYGLYQGLRAAIQGRVMRHQQTMRSLYFWALGIAGLFTLMPGRVMARMWFGEYQLAGFVAVLALASLIWLRHRAKTSA